MESNGKLQNNMNMLHVYFICIVKHLEIFHLLLLSTFLYILNFYKHV